ncbi:transglutaminase domain-containing protein [Rurimicrobium arvi]
MKRICFVMFLVLFTCSRAHAGKLRKEEFQFLDSLVTKAGPMKGYSLRFIVDSITASCKDELQMTRAFYRWCFLYLELDLHRMKHPKNKPDNASSALMERKASPKGFADLFKAMCELKHISCRTVRGLIRLHEEDIGELDKEAIHYWSVIRVDHTDYVVDPSLCGGIWNNKMRFIDRQWTDAWWLTNRRLFAFTHFPDKPEDQLLEVPLKQIEFKNAPIPTATAIAIGLAPMSKSGMLKGYADSSMELQFLFAGPVRVPQMTISWDNHPQILVGADIDENGYYIGIPFSKPGDHVCYIYANSSLAFIYKAKVARGRKVREYKR